MSNLNASDDKWLPFETQLFLETVKFYNGNWAEISQGYRDNFKKIKPYTRRPMSKYSEKYLIRHYNYLMDKNEDITQKVTILTEDDLAKLDALHAFYAKEKLDYVRKNAGAVFAERDKLAKEIEYMRANFQNITEEEMDEIAEAERKEQDKLKARNQERKDTRRAGRAAQKERHRIKRAQQQDSMNPLSPISLTDPSSSEEEEVIRIFDNYLSVGPLPMKDHQATSGASTSSASISGASISGASTSAAAALAVNPQAQKSPQTSPLLSSLLKSPTTSTISTVPPLVGAPAVAAAAATTTTTSASSSVRTTAPTITTLLTSGAIPNPNQPAIILKNNTVEAVHILKRPISGPPLEITTSAQNISSSLNLISPSQSAPTLSMLLEKTKNSAAGEDANPTTAQSSAVAKTGQQIKDSCNLEGKNSHLKSSTSKDGRKIDATKSSDEMNIVTETPVVLGQSGTGGVGVQSVRINDPDEPDQTEEQQLLEVFKNIGTMDDLGIDVADVDVADVDFIKDDVDIEDAKEVAPEIVMPNFKDPLESKKTEQRVPLTAANTNESVEVKKPESAKRNTTTLPDHESTMDKKIPTRSVGRPKGNKRIDITSSDDSNDNIPLATVASLESKDRVLPSSPRRSGVGGGGSSSSCSGGSTKDPHTEKKTELATAELKASRNEDDNKQEVGKLSERRSTKDSNDVRRPPLPLHGSENSSSSDVIVIPTDDDDDDDDDNAEDESNTQLQKTTKQKTEKQIEETAEETAVAAATTEEKEKQKEEKIPTAAAATTSSS